LCNVSSRNTYFNSNVAGIGLFRSIGSYGTWSFSDSDSNCQKLSDYPYWRGAFIRFINTEIAMWYNRTAQGIFSFTIGSYGTLSFSDSYCHELSEYPYPGASKFINRYTNCNVVQLHRAFLPLVLMGLRVFQIHIAMN